MIIALSPSAVTEWNPIGRFCDDEIIDNIFEMGSNSIGTGHATSTLPFSSNAKSTLAFEVDGIPVGIVTFEK